MAISAAHLLHHVNVMLPLADPRSFPAVGQRQEELGGGKGKGRGIDANCLMHTSKYHWQPQKTQSKGGMSALLGKGGHSVFHAQEEGQGGHFARHGGQSFASSPTPGAKAKVGKFYGEQLKNLGESRGNGVRFNVPKVKKKFLKVCRKWQADGKRNQAPPAGQEQERGGAKGYMGAACQIAASAVELLKAKNELTGNFWAASSKSAREIKRSEVLRLARLVAGRQRDPLPLSQEVVEGVAACLKSSGMKSGDQYLNELKLLHVEEGYDLPPWLVRTLSLCKKALTRNKGPAKRAAEARLENISEDCWNRHGSEFNGGINPAVAYAWACVWMLREIEAGACKWEHVRADEQSRQVTLTIPISKMDQTAAGLKRTLQCCGEDTCSRFCAWRLWERIGRECPRKFKRKGFVFVGNNMEKLSKNKMIELWNTATCCRVSGHSARRSGAMEHVRRGLQIQELAFLGRWKSAVVLTYANDALQEVPTNKNVVSDKNAMEACYAGAPWTPLPSAQTPSARAPMTPMARMCPVPPAEPVAKETDEVRPMRQSLWVASTDSRKGKKTWHRVSKAGWQINMSEWSTACGWNFTKNPDKVSMNASLIFNQTKCKKCTEVMKIRDKVREGHNLADFLRMESQNLL